MHFLIRLCIVALLFLPSVNMLAAGMENSEGASITIDASRPIEPPGPADFNGGTKKNPTGQTIGMNARYLELNGKPWLPVMGEFHYTRVPAQEWEDEILKMKAAGVQIIATYVIWIHHEEVEGQFDWSGDRDLRSFVELCAKHDMYVYPRIGPWAHGEARNGGFPDWLLKKTSNLRSNDPVYLSYAKNFYNQIGKQLNGLMWKDGGPVIGIQLENEYSMRGPDKGEAHILQLKKMAIAAGLDVPLYSVTGWDNAVVPKGEVVAVFGGYPDAPWDSSMDQLPPEEVYAFRFGSRVTGSVGAIGSTGDTHEVSGYAFPFITAEMGGGVEDTYHRRPVIAPDDVVAMMPVMLGSGVNLYGTYMFQGGQNPEGKLTTLQESQATNYPTDVPVKSYDFQAPISEFGEEREVLRKLKVFNYFLNDFGHRLAPMVVLSPSILPKGPRDLSTTRVAVRSDGKSGFLFFNNYVRGYPMPSRSGFQVKIKLSDGDLAFPNDPVNLPSGAYGIWPFGLQLGNVHLRYATGQLFCRTQSDTGDTYYFVQTRGVSTQFFIDKGEGIRLESRGKQELRNGGWSVTGLEPSTRPAIVATDGSGRTTRIILLSEDDAEDAWKLDADHLLITHSQFFADGDKLTFESDESSQFMFSVIPPLPEAPSAAAPIARGKSGEFASVFTCALSKVTPQVKIEALQEAGPMSQVKLGPPLPWRSHGVAMAPEDKEFANAAKWRISIPASDWSGVNKLFLLVKYDGDIARLTSGGRVIDDNFFNGEVWNVGLDRFRRQISEHGLELEILPRRRDAPIFLEKRFRQPPVVAAPNGLLSSAELVPQYRLEVTFSPKK